MKTKKAALKLVIVTLSILISASAFAQAPPSPDAPPEQAPTPPLPQQPPPPAQTSAPPLPQQPPPPAFAPAQLGQMVSPIALYPDPLLAQIFAAATYPDQIPDATPAKVVNKQTNRSHSTGEMLRTPVFWVLYMLFLLMAAGGLMAAANLAAIAKSYGVADNIIMFGTGTLAVGLIFANIMNGAARPLFGAVGDRIGHTNTMALSFALGAIAYFMMTVVGQSPWGFVLSAGLIFICWGQIFSLFPAFCTDLFGPKYATTNLSCLYTSKGVAGFLVPLASYIVALTHNWSNVLLLTMGINVVAVVLVLVVLRPAEARYHAAERDVTRVTSPAE